MDKQELPIHNPAERLYVILTRAAESPGESSIADVICKAMELETNSENFIRGFNELITLVDKIKEQIQFFSTPKQKGYLALIESIRKSLFTVIRFEGLNDLNLNNERSNKYLWKNLDELSNPNCSMLQFFTVFAADFKDCKIGIKKDHLNDLINNIENCIREISESQLDEEIKNFFIYKFIEIKHLLEKYYYYGSSRIKTEIYATMMEIGLYQENLPEDKKEENRSFFNASFEKLSQWAGIVNAPMNTVVIADKLLPIISQTAKLVGNTVKHLLPPGI